jgi:hypothetical protein
VIPKTDSSRGLNIKTVTDKVENYIVEGYNALCVPAEAITMKAEERKQGKTFVQRNIF